MGGVSKVTRRRGGKNHCSLGLVAPRKTRSGVDEEDDVGRAALEGLRVIDVATDLSGAYAARLLADLGADVVKLEDRASGDPTRRHGAAVTSRDAPLGGGARFAALNQNKRSVALDLRSERGRALWRRLLETADVIVDSGALAEQGCSAEQLRETNSSLITASVSAFGADGPYADRPACALTIAALGGYLKSLGDREREPLHVGFAFVEHVAGVVAAIGVLAARRAVTSGQPGQDVEVPQQEVALRMPLYPTIAARVGHATERRTPFPMYVDTLTGFAAVNALSATHFRDACLYMGLDDVADDRRLAADSALRGEVAPALQERMNDWAADKTREEIFHVGQAMRIPTGIPYTLLEVVQEDAYSQRGFFRPLDTRIGPVQQPVGPVSGSSAARDEWSAAPELGEHTDIVVEQWLEQR
jgi:crotonobetainyl-CoA:carnitine CoA-transferase CaiB-like acyl-CoA transferase